MPQAPNVEGLPLWLQVTITLIFGVATLVVMLRSYNASANKAEGSAIQAGPTIAHLADMGAVRHLAEVCHTLSSDVVSLERCIGEMTHHLRQSNDIDRELCQRLRELRERLDQQLR